MRFIVETTDGQMSFIGTAPQFEEGGVLRIDPDDPKPDEIRGPTQWLSPGFWQLIMEDVSYHPLKADYYLR
jgi:hypothetical protein